jgi:hypothetical protein
MHTSLRVIGVLPDRLLSVILGLGFCRWASAQAVHEPAGVVLMWVILSRSGSGRVGVEPVEDAVEDLLASALALAGGVVALP